MYDEFLLQVMKPARYIGKEWNVSRKDFNSAAIKFALCFPDLYEVGMSNLGIRIIYGVLNNIPDICCERFFSPAQDMEKVLRDNHLELLSLESRRKLREFDLVGFSLSYELSYTNILNILDLGGLPLKASERDYHYPLVIGGGPCTLNPEPMHAFFDLFLIGEAEEAIVELVNLYRQNRTAFKSGALPKEELLMLLTRIEGVYVPSLYDVEYTAEGMIVEFKPKNKNVPQRVKKRFIRDLSQAFFPLEWLVPYIQLIHDRLTLEIMRGCPNQCRFCQARQLYHPFRIRKKEQVVDYAKKLYQCSGYEEMSLIGLSVSDYPHLHELVGELIGYFKDEVVSVSLPSIKPKAMVGELAALLAGVKKTGLTFAPEAASEKLLKVLNKDFNRESFFRALKQAYQAGYQHIKLYFMTGLPFEDEADLEGIINFALEASELRRQEAGFSGGVNISINTLIPKPHTPFQWFKMDNLEKIREKQSYLKEKARKYRKLKLNFHSPQMSILEAVLSRGDRRLSEVIQGAFSRQARFDSWENHFCADKWQEAFRQAGLDPGFYLEAKKQQEQLPWDFLETGISKSTLVDEYNKIVA